MRRREFIALLGGAAAWPYAAHAQQRGGLPRIGYLSDESEAHHPFNSRDSVMDGLRQRGYVEGRDIVVEYRFAGGKVERLSSLATELGALPVDMIFTVGTPATRAAMNATRTIPIVFTRIGDPVRSGFVVSLARPGRNATGFSVLVSDLVEKRLQLLTQVVPGIARIAVLHERNFEPGNYELAQLMAAARPMGLHVHAVAATPPDVATIDAALPKIMEGSPQALFVGSSGWFEDVHPHVVELAFRSGLPALFVRREYAEAGGCMSYGVSYPSMYRLATDYIVRVLKGANPADLPVQQPVVVELVINMKTVRAIGVEIPPFLLARADEVIE